MSNPSRARRRARERAAHRDRPRSLPPSRSTLNGVPVYDGYVVEVASGEVGGRRDDRVVVGVGPEGEVPVAYVLLCPCEGVRGFVDDLVTVGAQAAEHHPTHL